MSRWIRSWIVKIGCLLRFPATGALIHPTAVLGLTEGSRILLGRGSRIGRHAMLYFNPGSLLDIGPNTHLSHYVNIRPGKLMRIGRDVRIGQFVSIIGDNHVFDRTDIPIFMQGVQTTDVIIEDDVWIGAHAVVLPGVMIGRGSVIGAGAVVTKNIPPFSIAVGNPARVIRRRGDVKSE